MWCARAGFAFVFVTTMGWTQENAPAGLLKGAFLSFTGTPRGGQFIFQSSGDQLYSCTYDDKTYIERESRLITIAGAKTGDRLRVVSDYKDDSMVCYARLVHILEMEHVYVVRGVRPRSKASNRPVEPFGPRGNMTLSGLIVGVKSNILTLKSRAGEYQSIQLRPDTRYSTAG